MSTQTTNYLSDFIEPITTSSFGLYNLNERPELCVKEHYFCKWAESEISAIVGGNGHYEEAGQSSMELSTGYLTDLLCTQFA